MKGNQILISERWRIVKIISFLSIIFLSTSEADKTTKLPLKPNVVIFIADDLGIGDVGCFGNDTIRTPNIDRIARDGAKLTHNLAAEALCTPSRTALMTARYPIRSGMSSSHRLRVILHTAAMAGLPPNETTIGEAAQEMGYATALIGKWHLGVHCGMNDLYCHHPLKQGFDYYYGVPLTNLKDYGNDRESVVIGGAPHTNGLIISIGFGGCIFSMFLFRMNVLGKRTAFALALLIFIMPSVYTYFALNNLKLMNSMIMRNYDSVEQPINFENITGNLVNEGVKFLKEQSVNKKPFLLVMSWLQVHTVLHASKRFRGKSAHGAYGDNVEEMDNSVGEILAALKKLGLLDNTLVYFTSDNGGHLEERNHGRQEGGWNGIYRGGKGQGGMDGGIRMPTVAMWKGHIKPNTTINVPTSQMDILPTLLSVWGEALPKDRIIDGKNIYPLLTGQDPTPPHRFLMHYCGSEIHAARYVPDKGEDVYKVYYITPKWTPGTYTCEYMCQCDEEFLVRHSTPLLYNIGKDPSEISPLSTDEPANKKIVQLVSDAVRSHQQTVQSVPNQFSIGRLLPLPWLQHCCNFPYCSCRDPVYFKE